MRPVLVARTAFEGLVYVEAYRNSTTSLEKNGCYYAIYEAYREECERNGKLQQTYGYATTDFNTVLTLYKMRRSIRF